MPLNELAKKKLKQYLRELMKYAEEEDFTKIPNKSSLFSSMGEIFDEDEEWGAEIFASGILIAVLSVYFEDNKLSDEVKKEYSAILKRNFSDAYDAVSNEDWLKYHKSFRNALWNINKSSK